jgi:hypothetical protein
MATACLHDACFCERDGADCCGAYCTDMVARRARDPTCECGHIVCEEATMRGGGVYTTNR